MSVTINGQTIRFPYCFTPTKKQLHNDLALVLDANTIYKVIAHLVYMQSYRDQFCSSSKMDAA